MKRFPHHLLFLSFFFLTILYGCDFAAPQPDCPGYMVLDRGWEFAEEGSNEWLPAEVPGTVQTDLMRHGKLPDPFVGMQEKAVQWVETKDWTYRYSLNIPSSWLPHRNYELLFEGLDTYASIYLDGELVQESNNQFRSWTVPLRNIKPGSTHELEVRFHSPLTHQPERWENLPYTLPAGSDQGDPAVSIFTRKAPYHFGWDWAPRVVTTGIWKAVKLRSWNTVRITDVFFKQTALSDEVASVQAQVEIETDEATEVTLTIGEDTEHGMLVETTQPLRKGRNIITLFFDIKNPERWWTNGLGEAKLYELFAAVKADGCADLMRKKFGFRDLQLERTKDSTGESFTFWLNGEPLFIKGANYIPQDVFLHRVKPEQYEQLIQSVVKTHGNMLRVWGGGVYERDLFYDLCDQYGILVWQDFMFACSMYPGDADFMNNVRAEATEVVKRLRNHPSLAMWCGNNESNVAWFNWGWQGAHNIHGEDSTKVYSDYLALFEKLLPEVVAVNDPGRAYIPSSPISNWGTPANFNTGNMHYWGVWHGEEPFANFWKNVPRFMSEYGFQSFPEFETVKAFTAEADRALDSEVMNWHQKSYKGNRLIFEHLDAEFGPAKDFEAFLYQSQVLQAYGIEMAINSHRVNRPHCMGTLYWQLNDCWPGPSWSGIDYYGRWKAFHHRLTKLYEPVHLVFDSSVGAADLFVVSDLRQDQDLQLHCSLLTFLGDTIKSESKTITVAANQVTKVWEEAWINADTELDSTKTFVVAELWDSKGMVSRSLQFMARPKNLQLPPKEFAISHRIQDGNLQIKMKGLNLQRYLQFSVPGVEGHFSENYFDLLPGEERIITFTPKNQADLTDQFTLHARSLNDPRPNNN